MTGKRAAIVNAMTVDVEDYFHVTAFAGSLDRAKWSGLESRVERNTTRLLEIFARHDLRITFFVLGLVAERFPALIRELYRAGHEIAARRSGGR
jgi:peptidoglycan-N-acetylglucosamine deacetylase